MSRPAAGEGGSPPTIYDVARESGVAPSTVSRAFSRPGRVNAATAQRIRAVADRLGYHANPLARALPTGRTAMLALVVTDVTNPVYFPVIRGAQAAAAAAGYTMLLADAQESARTERAAIERALPIVEGVVLAGSRLADSAIRTMAEHIPLVIVNRAVVGVSSVATDNARGIRRAIEHLGELGHTSITYVAGPEASWADGMRWRAAREACHELELKLHRIGPCAPTLRGGVEAAPELARHSATAALAYNDLLAIGLLRGLAQQGIRVPGEISVVGFDNIFGSDFASPALTTVAAPLRALGTTGVEQVIAQIGGAPARTAATLPAQLVVRESTGQRRRKRTSPAFRTSKVSGSAAQASGSTSRGSR